MLKFLAGGAENPLIGLGLSRENINRLIEGKPIQVKLSDLGLKGELAGVRIAILFGETEEAMVEDFRKQGLIGPGTKDVSKKP